jgi:signal transduction histidine kinase/DNA-binding NarL/FixJ family response regulator
MRVFLLISSSEAIRAAVRAACAEDDVLLCEVTPESAARRLVSLRVDAILADETPEARAPAIAELRALAPAAPILVLCDEGRRSPSASYYRLGAHACLEKPLDTAILRDALNRAAAAGTPAKTKEAPATAETPRFAVGQHQMALRWLGRASAQEESPARLADRLSEFCADLFDAVRCYVLLESENGVVTVHARAGHTEAVAAELRLRYTGGIMRWFEEQGCLIDRELASVPPDALQEMQLLQARMGAPLFREGRVHGALLLGDKASAPHYTAEERELLTLVARCVSVFFGKAREQDENRRRQRRLDAVLAHINAGVVTVDPNSTITLMNQSAERLLNQRAAEVLGRRVQALPAAIAGAAARALEDGLPRVHQEIRDEALEHPLGLSVTPMGGDGVVAVFWALPEEASAPAGEDGGAFWHFLAGRVAQEIKNPMVAISTFAQLLPQKYDSADFRENFSVVVQEEVARINQVVNHLVEFSQAPELRRETGDVSRIVRAVLDTFAPELREHGIALDAHITGSPLIARLDPIFFAQAVHNVVRNAVEAMSGGGELEVAVEQVGDAVEVRVRDTGRGLTREQAARAFLPFFSGKERGMGLGLPVARRILRAHGGALRLIESGEGGCCFALQIPIARVAHADHTGH